MGATLAHGGVVFRTWAPSARDVYVVTDEASTNNWTTWTPTASERLVPLGDGTWAGFVRGLTSGSPYLFWVRGPEGGSEGFKRDPYARELASTPSFPNCPSLVRPVNSYPWRTSGWRPPAFRDFIVYQLHVGAFWAVDAHGNDDRERYGRFLDVIERIPYLHDLGITAVQLLPVQEYDNDRGLGYAGLDYFSPEMAYQFHDEQELRRHLATINAMFGSRGLPPLETADIRCGPNQLKCLIDLCHLHGLAVIFDVVYNHAGGDFGERSLWFYDRQPWGDPNKSLYFTNNGWAGGMVFAYWQAPVRQFLIDNASFWLKEYQIDGLRYDEVSVMHRFGGDRCCRDLTDTLHAERPETINIAEYWDWNRALPVTTTRDGGLGFDAGLDDRLRNSVRSALEEASAGASNQVNLDAVAGAFSTPPGFSAAWRTVPHLENHDVVLWDAWDQRPRDLRIARRADPSNPRSWFARSRSRVATTWLMTAPGIPLLFMGQEILEDKPWSDDVKNWPQFLIWWAGLTSDRHMRDFHQFVQDLTWLRRNHDALRGDGVRVSQVHDDDRVLVVHRWVEGVGNDLVIVSSLNEQTLEGYRVDMPYPGSWREIFNSDYYDHFPNPIVSGNAGGVRADQQGARTYPYAAIMRIPANGALVFARG
jgi:1,4-alpha-glucan branching enzyme